MVDLDPFSLTSYLIDCLYEDKTLAIGTCFFVKREEHFFLVTNWHNVTGRNPATKEYLGSYAVSPTALRVMVLKKGRPLEWTPVVIQLYNDSFEPLWLEHPIFNEEVDVVVLPVSLPPDVEVFDIDRGLDPYNDTTSVRISNDVFVIGFPMGLTGTQHFPIWKRASVATEPDFDIDDLPKMYLDTATRQGMSGSPVIFKKNRPLAIGDGAPGEEVNTNTHFVRLIGIYSGRLGAKDEFQAQLGLVWKSRVIDEILDQGKTQRFYPALNILFPDKFLVKPRY